MDGISIAELRERIEEIGVGKLSEKERHKREKQAQQQLMAECSPGGSMLLFTFARLSSVVKDLPDVVRIGRTSLQLARDRHGVWHLHGEEISLGLVTMRLGEQRGQALEQLVRDLELGRVDVAVAELDKLIKVKPDEIFAMLQGLRASVPAHAFNAILSMGRMLDQFSSNGEADVQAIMSAMIEEGADVNAPPATGQMPPLQAATMAGDHLTMQVLIEHGADVNATHDSWSPFELAVAMGNQGSTQVLIDANASMKTARSLLHLAIDVGSRNTAAAKALVETLRSIGANPVERDGLGMSPLDHAKEVVEKLSQQGRSLRRDEDLGIMKRLTSYIEGWARAASA